MAHSPATGPTLQSTEPLASCQVDWATVSFRIPTSEWADRLHAFAYDLAEACVPTGQPFVLKPGLNYVRSYSHPSGVRLECSRTEDESQGGGVPRNHSLAVVSIPGKVWGSLDAQLRSALFCQLRRDHIFVRCTRLDCQITMLNPELSATDVVREVTAGRLWPKGFTVGNPYGTLNSHGEYTSSPTQYFGAKTSRIRARVYDKAAESGWEIPAVRHELQMRDEPADQHFRRLAERAAGQTDLGPLLHTAEETTVKQVLMQHLDYRDTSQWAGERKPQNWARTAPTPDWWRKALAVKHDPLAIAYKPEGTLRQTWEQCKAQYARKALLCMAGEAATGKVTMLSFLGELLFAGFGKLKRDDLQVLLAEYPEAPETALRYILDTGAAYVAMCEEGQPEEAWKRHLAPLLVNTGAELTEPPVSPERRNGEKGGVRSVSPSDRAESRAEGPPTNPLPQVGGAHGFGGEAAQERKRKRKRR